ncbi:hypothetical protein WJX73_005043 [Symbiochloris irregularis]|uniref:Dynamin GTPase n=1 Tax=Symbiochloris irregularis TaxID=706552 RepID=A0AAW1NPM2_9CHLO
MSETGGGNEVLVDAAQLQELLPRLQDRRSMVEKEAKKLPDAPRGKDIFQLCRGFERAFAHIVESSDYSGLIRRAFQHEGLQGAISQLPLERKFKLQMVKDVVREADGYQGHLVSPELGLRRMVDETLGLVVDPVATCVRRVHQVLIDVAREASKKASLLTESSTLDPTKEALKLPAFEQAAMLACTKALEAWRDEALEVAKTMVTMEQTYITAAFFRHLQYERYRAAEMAQFDEGHQQLAAGQGVAAESDSDDDRDDADSSLDGYAESTAPAKQPKPEGGNGAAAKPRSGGEGTGDIKTGFLEKRIGENSGRQNLPESMKWQKRYFVLTETKGMLYYFKSADDPPNYRGVINVKEARVEDVDVDGLPKGNAKSKYDLDGGAGQVSLLIRLSHKNPSKPLVKNHQSLVLRAESASEKYAWLARLKYASDYTGGPGTPLRSYDSAKLLEQARKGEDELGRLGMDPSNKGEKEKKSKKDRPSPQTSQAAQFMPPGPPSGPITPHPEIATGGIGSTLDFGEDASLGPEPMLFNVRNPAGFVRNPAAGDPNVFDDFLQQLGEDTAAYVRTVCQTIVLTVPKAVIHCMVKRAQGHLLEFLYSHVTQLGGIEAENLLDEDPGIMQRRAAGKKSLLDLEEAIRVITRVIDQRMEQSGSERKDRVAIPASVLELAGGTGGPLENGNTRVSAPRRTTSSTGSTSRPPPNALPSRPAPPPAAASSGLPTPRSGPTDLSQPSPVPRRRPPPAPPGSK